MARFDYSCMECGQVNEGARVHTGCISCGRDAVEKVGWCDECGTLQAERQLSVVWATDNTECFVLCPCCTAKDAKAKVLKRTLDCLTDAAAELERRGHIGMSMRTQDVANELQMHM